jgi:hypothetical protein
MPDVVVQFTIPSDKVATVRQGFFKKHPKQDDSLTDVQHFKAVVVDYVKRVTRSGLREISEEGTDLSDVVVE